MATDMYIHIQIYIYITYIYMYVFMYVCMYVCICQRARCISGPRLGRLPGGACLLACLPFCLLACLPACCPAVPACCLARCGLSIFVPLLRPLFVSRYIIVTHICETQRPCNYFEPWTGGASHHAAWHPKVCACICLHRFSPSIYIYNTISNI